MAKKLVHKIIAICSIHYYNIAFYDTAFNTMELRIIISKNFNAIKKPALT